MLPLACQQQRDQALCPCCASAIFTVFVLWEKQWLPANKQITLYLTVTWLHSQNEQITQMRNREGKWMFPVRESFHSESQSKAIHHKWINFPFQIGVFCGMNQRGVGEACLHTWIHEHSGYLTQWLKNPIIFEPCKSLLLTCTNSAVFCVHCNNLLQHRSWESHRFLLGAAACLVLIAYENMLENEVYIYIGH